MEYSKVHSAELIQTRADLLASARSGQPERAQLHEVCPARDVAAGLRDSAAEILDKAARDEVGAD